MTINRLLGARAILVFIFCTFLSQISYGQKIVAGFFGDWHTATQLNNVQFDKLTDIYYAFIKSDNSGNASPTTANGFTTILTPMVTKAHAKGVRCHVSLGGAGAASSNLSQVIGTASSRNNLINSIKTIIQTYNLDGFNMDWEFPAATDAANLTQFMVDMRTAMNGLEATMGKELYLSAAVGPLLWNTDGINSTFIAQCDYIYVMAFDAGGSCCVCDASNHSSMNIAKWSVEKWTNVGLPWASGCGGNTAAKNAPASKIVLAIPFYSQSADYVNFSASDPAGYYNDADGILNGHGYNSRPLIEQKVDYIMNTIGGAGVWCWELPADRNDQYSLLNVMWTKMQPYMCPFPQPNLGADKSLCGVSSISLDCGVPAVTGRTFSWKKDGATYTGTTPAITVTAAGTYEVTVSQGGCTKTDQIIVSNTLTAPDFSSVPSNLCTTLPYTLTPANVASFPSGTTWQWQKDGSNVAGAITSSLSGIKTAGAYKLTATSGSCTSNATKTLTSSLPTPVDGSGPSGSAISLSITNATGGPYNWFTAATNGTQVATGTSYSPVLTTTTTYYVQDGAGISGAAAGTGEFGTDSWTIAAPSAKMDFTTNVPLSITSVDLYILPWGKTTGMVLSIEKSDGTLVGSTSAVTYDNSSAAVYKLTVNTSAIPQLGAGNYRMWLSAGTSDLRTTTTTFSVASVISMTGGTRFYNNIKYVSGSTCVRLPVTATVTAGVAAPSVISPVTYCQNATAVALSATPSSGGTLKWYGTNATGGTASATAPIPSTATAGTVSYYVSQTVGGVESSRAKIDVIINASPVISATTPGARCGTGTVVLGATASAGTLNWYNVSTNGTSLGTGTSFTTPSISATTTYYVSATNGGCTSARTAVVATVNTTPTVSSTTPASRCGTGTIVLGATASAGTLNWYNVSTNGTSLGTGTSFTTPSISATTTYYVSATNGGCTSARTPVVATVTVTPTVSSTTPASRCGTGTVVLEATASAGTLNWYNVSTNGTSLGTGTSFTTPSISATTTYYVSATNGGCTSARTAVVATVNTVPTISGTTPGSRCGTGTVVLGATASAGTLNWYNVSTNGTSLGTGTSFTTPSISATTTYYVSATNGGCTSARTAVVATVNAIPTVSSTTPAARCGTGTVVLGATASAGTLNWYNVPANGTSLGTGTSFTTPNISATTTYYVSATNGVCTSARTAVVASISSSLTPAVTISVSQTTVCSNTPVTFTAVSTNAGTAPAYQWKINNINAASTTSTYTSSSLVNGDVITVELTSSESCASPAKVTSAGTTMTVNSLPGTSSGFVTSTNVVDATQAGVAYSVGVASGATTYTWSYSGAGAAINGNGTSSVVIDFSNATSGTLSVIPKNNCGSAAPVVLDITVNGANPVTPHPGDINIYTNPVFAGTTGVMYCVTNVPGTTYTWSYNGSGATINGNGSNCITIDYTNSASSGTLSVVASNGNNPPSSPSSLDIEVKTTTGVKPALEGVTLKAYPNPFEFTSTILIDMAAGAQVDMEIYNAYGIKVKTLMNQEYLGSGSHEVKISELATGVYFVKLKIGDRNTTIKLVKHQ